MTRIRKITPNEEKGEQIRYDLTMQVGNEKKRISLSKDFLDLAKKELTKRTHNEVDINDRTLITFAILNLFDPAVQNIVRHYLETDHQLRSVTKLLALNNTNYQDPSTRISNQINDLQDSNNRQDIMLESLINAVSFLLYDRNHMTTSEDARTADDVYAQLREDGLKKVIDTVLRAGLNESDRQRHLDNL